MATEEAGLAGWEVEDFVKAEVGMAAEEAGVALGFD